MIIVSLRWGTKCCAPSWIEMATMRLTPELLIAGYCQGLFPMADDDGEIYWYDPHPRAIIPLDAFHIPRRLARRVRNGGFEIRVDHDFRAIMAACAEPRPDHAGT